MTTILLGISAKEIPLISFTALRGNPSGSQVFHGSLESAQPSFPSVLCMLKSFCPNAVIAGASPLMDSRGPVHTPVKLRLGAGPPGPISFNLLYKLFPKPAPACPIAIGAKTAEAIRPIESRAKSFRIGSFLQRGREFLAE